MNIKIYHNPKCSNSRKALALLQENNAKIEIIEYLKYPPSRKVIHALAKKMENPKALLREKEVLAKELNLIGAKDTVIIDAIAAHPILLNRPVVETETKAIIARPPSLVLKLL